MQEPEKDQYIPFSQLAILARAKVNINNTSNMLEKNQYISALKKTWENITVEKDIDVNTLIDNPAELILRLLHKPTAILSNADRWYLHWQAAENWA
jgi:hypothetical protein